MPAFLESENYYQIIKNSHPILEFDFNNYNLPHYVFRQSATEPLIDSNIIKFLNLMPRKIKYPKLFCIGTPFESYDQTIYFSNFLNTNNKEQILNQKIELAKNNNSDLLCFTSCELDQNNLELTRILKNLGFYILPCFPDMVLKTDANFKNYLKILKSRERSSILRNIQNFNNSQIILRNIDSNSSKQTIRNIYDSYLNQFDRAKIKWIKHNFGFFDQLIQLNKITNHICFTAAYHRSELVGFVYAFQESNRLEGGRIGVLPKFQNRHSIYFRLLYSLIEHACESSEITKLSLSPTTYKLKHQLGAEFQLLYNIVMPVSKTWQITLKACYKHIYDSLKHLQDKKQLKNLY